jgi:lysophospholipase L1-like esterase
MMRKQIAKFIFLVLATALGFVNGTIAQTKWVATWATSPQQATDENVVMAEELRAGTLRQVVHLSLGGTRLRLHLSNRYGSAPLHIAGVHVAKAVSAGSAKIVVSSDKALLFSGKRDVIIPEGADYISDSLDFPVTPLSDLAITLRLESEAKGITGHPGSRATSFLYSGSALGAEDFPDAKKITRWYFIAGVDVEAHSGAFSIVALGDSITDGHGATTDGNNRWPDLFARRLQTNRATRKIGIVNQGIGGNRLLVDGIAANALARFDHDVLAQAGVRYVILLEGINDLGMLTHESEVSEEEHAVEVRRVTDAYEQILERAHAQGIKVIGATLTPFVGSEFYHPNEKNEADRQAINQWIQKHFDGVVDFDRIVRDPEHPEKMLPTFDSGDHLHPSPAGFAAMVEAIPLSLFAN